MFKTIKISKICLFTAVTAFAILCAGLFRGLRASGADGGVDVPIVMYHSVVRDASLAGDYVVTTDTLESDIAYILGQGFTPVFCSELADFTAGKSSLPEKPIVISFDDGCYNNFYYVLPILEKYKVKAEFSIVGEWCMAAGEEASPSPQYSSMNLENVKALVSSGYCEIANHSWNLHSYTDRRGVCPLDGEDENDYRRMLYNNACKARNYLEQSGAEIRTFVYPYGYTCELTETVIKELGYDVTLGCEERVNRIAEGDYSCLRNMGRFNRASGTSSSDFFSEMGI
jgi:peptidoglycan/xylan/chitin deacetylase (PgdA/CDA1 family)